MATVIYGALALAYSRFYAELGVRPADVGVQFGTGLAGAAGLTFGIVAVAAAMTIIGAALWILAGRLLGRTRLSFFQEKVSGRGVVLAAAATVVILGLGFTGYFMFTADSWADRVKQGKPVEPVMIIGVEILGVRADLAQVEPVADGDESATLRALERRPDVNPELLYLGRSSAAVILYDSKTQSAEHIPDAYVIVTALNCETKMSKAKACVRLRERERVGR